MSHHSVMDRHDPKTCLSSSVLHELALQLSLVLTSVTNVSSRENEVIGVESNDSPTEVIFPPSMEGKDEQ